MSLKLVIWTIFAGDLPYHANPLFEIMDGMCIYMFFDFGDRKYYVLYGWIHFRILDYWKKRHHVAIEIMNKAAQLNKQTKKRKRQEDVPVKRR